MQRILITLCLGLALTACSVATPTPQLAKVSETEVTGTQAERVTAISKVITNKGTRPLPSPLLDAHLLERQNGDGNLGPSDFTSFITLDVDPSTVAAWRAVGTALVDKPSFSAPTTPPAWWVTPAAFTTLSFHDVHWFTDRQGWMGMSSDGHIYMMTFTS